MRLLFVFYLVTIHRIVIIGVKPASCWRRQVMGSYSRHSQEENGWSEGNTRGVGLNSPDSNSAFIFPSRMALENTLASRAGKRVQKVKCFWETKFRPQNPGWQIQLQNKQQESKQTENKWGAGEMSQQLRRLLFSQRTRIQFLASPQDGSQTAL